MTGSMISRKCPAGPWKKHVACGIVVEYLCCRSLLKVPYMNAAASHIIAMTGLTKNQLLTYHKDGYLIIPKALSSATVTALLEETNNLLTTIPLSSHPLTRFTTGENTSHISDEYFLTSGDKIRYFFEEGAFSPPTGALCKPPHRAINKIGHYLHELSPPFRAATLTPTHADIARSLGFRDPRVLQSMVICKQPEIGGQVPPHQDSTFLYTNPPSAVGFWIALENATVRNGCLNFAPGSHRRTPIRKRFVRTEGGRAGFGDVDGERFPMAEEPEEIGKDDEVEEQYKVGEVEAGTLVLIHGNLLHQSEQNVSENSRFIYTFHIIEGEHEYDERNWLQPPKVGFTKLYESS